MAGGASVSGAAHDAALLRVSKASKKTLDLFGEGVHLAAQTSRPIDDLRQQVCADRLDLASHFLAAGNKTLRTRPPEYRTSISRFYYSMYHAVRAVVYFAYGGDDHESHSVLPGKIPNDFIDAAIWQNALKDARAHRNAADYDPYPVDVASWRATAHSLAVEAPNLISLSRQYLKAKGCAYL
ncbi:hypothetical protein GCM10023191_069880 [Actinoallomurus oryzae]|uniref:HEPN domain-containing protein n=1 Tax=Actinoallomurus oryzae TaxID=502180 RepID=A0ABP8QT74_9ACTN